MGIVRPVYGNMAVMEHVPLRSDVHLGDQLVTSGFSQIYTPDIPVGRVISIEKNRNSLFLDIGIRLAVDFNCLHHILIVQTGRPSEGINFHE